MSRPPNYLLPTLLPLALMSLHCGTGAPADPGARPRTTDPTSTRAPLPFLRVAAERTLKGSGPTVAQPARTLPATRDVPQIELPSMGGAALFSTAGSASIVPGTTAGTASYSGAPVIDVQSSAPPTAIGSGSFDVTVDGVQYASTAAESLAYTFNDVDQNGVPTDYLVLGTWVVDVDPATQIETASVVYVLTPAADFAPGATVTFDGVDRVAIFYTGDTALPEPQVAAVALTGSVVFGASGSISIGGSVDAALSGDFSEITIAPQPTPTPTPVGAIAAGTYDLSYVPVADAYCDGTLSGQESSFLGLLPADLGLADGVVALALPAADMIEVSGAAGFGAGALALGSDPGGPPGVFYAVVGSSGAGPLATNQVMQFLMLDDASASSAHVAGFAGVGFETADQQGFCQVGFEFDLTP